MKYTQMRRTAKQKKNVMSIFEFNNFSFGNNDA